MSPASLLQDNPASIQRPRRIAWCVIFIWAFFLFVPFDAFVVPTGMLDRAWMLALHAEHANGARFGRDIIFTYGPAGFLLSPVYFPATYAIMLFWRALLIIIPFGCFLQILRQCNLSTHLPGEPGRPRHEILARYSIPALITLALCLSCDRMEWNQDPLPVALATIILVLYFFLPRKSIFLTCTTLVALLVLGIAKQSYLGLAALIVAAIFLDCVFRRDLKDILYIGVAVIIGWWLGWCVIGGQHCRDFFHFLAVSSTVARSYLEAMAYSGRPISAQSTRILKPRLEALLIAAFAANCLLVAIAAVATEFRMSRQRWIANGVLILLIAFIFKVGCIRPDVAHTGSGAAAMLCLILICAVPLKWLEGKFARLLIIVPGLFFLALFLASASRSRLVIDRTYPVFLFQETASSVHAAAMFLRHGDQWQRPRFDAALDEARTSVSPFPPGGHVEVYPSDLMLALALSHPFIPRPALQSYAAFDSLVETADADYLRSAAAPQRILFHIDPTDGRFPATDDALSWPVLLSRYRYIGLAGDYFAFAQRPNSLALTRTLLAHQNAVFTQWVTLPSDPALLWAKLTIKQSLWGQALTNFAHASSPLLEIRISNGAVLQYRLNREQAGCGFLISPFISTNDDFLSLIHLVQSPRTRSGANQVISFRLVTADRLDGAEFSPRFDVELYSLAFSSPKSP
ncbi:MAG TPA: hypothetical protein VGG19_12110 [Tepidisphaeraceae bacterium]